MTPSRIFSSEVLEVIPSIAKSWNISSDGKVYTFILRNDVFFHPHPDLTERNVRAKDFDEAVQLVNDHEFGNGTSIYTRDGDSGRTFANKIKIGMVGINIPIPVPVAVDYPMQQILLFRTSYH